MPITKSNGSRAVPREDCHSIARSFSNAGKAPTHCLTVVMPCLPLLTPQFLSAAACVSPRVFFPSSGGGEPWGPRSEETLGFRSGPDRRSEHLWSGSGGGLRGRGPLSGAGKGSPRRLEALRYSEYASYGVVSVQKTQTGWCDRARVAEAYCAGLTSGPALLS